MTVPLDPRRERYAEAITEHLWGDPEQIDDATTAVMHLAGQERQPTTPHGCTIDGQPAMPILVSEYNRMVADLAALRAVARGYCPECGRGDAGPTADDWEQQKQRADQTEREREGINRMYLNAMANLGIALNHLDQIRDAARLHEQTLISTRELYAVIDADAAPAPAATQATDGSCSAPAPETKPNTKEQ